MLGDRRGWWIISVRVCGWTVIAIEQQDDYTSRGSVSSRGKAGGHCTGIQSIVQRWQKGGMVETTVVMGGVGLAD